MIRQTAKSRQHKDPDREQDIQVGAGPPSLRYPCRVQDLVPPNIQVSAGPSSGLHPGREQDLLHLGSQVESRT
jgi:hypothetical protein